MRAVEYLAGILDPSSWNLIQKSDLISFGVSRNIIFIHLICVYFYDFIHSIRLYLIDLVSFIDEDKSEESKV